MTGERPRRRWPLFLIASPAAVAVWSGWVALGGLCGFGLVNLLPGIGDGFHLNTAITLPVGVEAYGAYALGAWLTPGTPQRARTFARRSAIGALVLGMAGQVIYHLLAAAGATRAPWPVVVLVSCMPVITLGFGAALTHLLRVPDDDPSGVPGVPAEEPDGTKGEDPAAAPEPTETPSAGVNGYAHPEAVPAAPVAHPAQLDVMATFSGDLTAGQTPSIRQIRRELRVGQDKAQEVQAYLKTLIRTP